MQNKTDHRLSAVTEKPRDAQHNLEIYMHTMNGPGGSSLGAKARMEAP